MPLYNYLYLIPKRENIAKSVANKFSNIQSLSYTERYEMAYDSLVDALMKADRPPSTHYLRTCITNKFLMYLRTRKVEVYNFTDLNATYSSINDGLTFEETLVSDDLSPEEVYIEMENNLEALEENERRIKIVKLILGDKYEGVLDRMSKKCMTSYDYKLIAKCRQTIEKFRK